MKSLINWLLGRTASVYEVQCRGAHGLRYFPNLEKAFQYAILDPSVWKVSFTSTSGDQVRLIRTKDGWLYETIWGNRFDGK